MHTGGEILAAFDAHQRVRGLSERTIKRRRSSLTRLAEVVAPRGILECEMLDIERWLARWSNAQTRYSYLGDVRALFRWATRRGLAEQNPADLIDPPRRPQMLPKPLPAGEVHRLVDATSGPTRRAVMLAAYAGLRVFEIANLDGRDIFNGHLIVRAGKGRKDRAIPMAPELAAELAGVGPGPVVDVLGRGGDAISDLVKAAMRRLGIAGTPHHLRHSFGTAAAAATGGNLMVVAELMGHTDMQTTRGYVRMVANAAVVADLYPRAATAAVIAS